MPNGFRQGRDAGYGRGNGIGFGFRGSSPPLPYAGRGRGYLPRCGYYSGNAGAPTHSSYQSQSFSSEMPHSPAHAPYSSKMTQEEELDYMKDQAEAIKGHLEEIESRMRDLEVEK